jgi:membrane dipeptidase
MDCLTLHRNSIVIDTHCDTLKCLLPVFTEPKDSMWEDRTNIGLGVKSTLGHVDIPRLQEGGITCQVFAISSERSRTPSHPLRTALEMVDRFHSECSRNSTSIIPVTGYEGIMKAKEKGRVAAMLSIEGADVLEGRVEMLSVFHRLGVRMVGLVHSLRNQLADGVSDRRTKGKLSQLGVEAVEEMNRLGIIVDASHLNDEGFWDVIDLSKTPIIASHSNSRAICDHPRNLKDDMIKALAENGGVMGMNFAPSFVNKDTATLSGLVNHIDHIIELTGADHVGLGSDFDGIPSTPAGLEDVTKIPHITKELMNRGYGEKEIKKILGENHLRLIREICK